MAPEFGGARFGRAHSILYGARDVNGLIMEPLHKIIDSSWRLHQGEIGVIGVIGNKGLREYGQLNPLLAAFFYGLDYLVLCAVPIENDVV